MPVRHVIVDGSNIATEGRSLPSLSQLDQAVREFLAENPQDVVTVVVDASFSHRIDPSELPTFEEAERAGEVVSPPAGAIGRGDAFLLRIAEKAGATVLSNDSFQEFHGEHDWLFDKGRLIGGKPVPGVGWIFMPRTPVRGQKSREVVKEAKRKKRAESTTAAAADGAQAATGLDLAASRSKGRGKKVDRAIARATEEAVEPKSGGRRRRKAGTPPAEPVNEPLPFITFIAAHPLGTEVVGTVAEFSSHGAFVVADGARCYLPLSAMGDPPPRRAREVLAKSEERMFVVQALDPPRRGIELALPGFARVAGAPTDETVEAEIHPALGAEPEERAVANGSSAAGAGAPAAGAPAKKPAAATKAGAKKAPAAKKAGAKAPAAKEAPAAKKAPAANKTARKAPASGEPVPVAEAVPAKKAAIKKAPVKKATAGTRTAAAAGEAKAAPASEQAPAKRATTKKTAGQKAPEKKAPAKKAPEKKAQAAGSAARARLAPAAGAAPATEASPATAKAAGAGTTGIRSAARAKVGVQEEKVAPTSP